MKKDPGADLRRLSNREKTMPVDRLRPRYSLKSMVSLPRYRAQQLPLYLFNGLCAGVFVQLFVEVWGW